MMERDFQQLIELAKQRDELRAAWYRHLLTLAAGGLAILAGLDPQIPDDRLSRVLLCATWALLGSGILGGGVATYLDADRAARLAAAFQSRLQQDMEQVKAGGAWSTTPVIAKPRWIFRIARVWMVLSLMGAVVCFVCFATWRTWLG